ncbi:Class I glutamine amidotransferase-like [Phytophthora cactorum]|nr:Class I glutamine amidotransferase-like [Phytophthora cactorum]
MVASMDDVPAPPRRVVSLLIDNYDSYTYNIMQMLAQVNGTPNSVTVIKNDDFAQEDVELEFNVVISPGPGHPSEPKDFGMCADAIRHATVPVLGVCLGHQGLAQAKEVMHGRTSRVFIEGEDALFAHIPNGFQVVRYHSLVIDPDNIPKELEVIAKTQDGVIMAVRHRSKQQFGVQFHPEAVCSEFGYQLLQNFRDVTLAQCASKRELHHSNHPEKNAKLHDQSVQELSQQTTAPGYRVLIQRASTGLASLEFAEFVFGVLFGASKRSFWLDSSNHDTVAGTDAATQSRCSMMGDDSGPLSYCVEYDVAKVELRLRRRVSDAEEVTLHPGQDILTHVRQVLQAHRSHQVVFNGGIELPFAFRGGFVGYFGYEVLGSEREGNKVWNDKTEVQGERAPDASFLFADRTLIFDHRDGVIYSLSLAECQVESESISQMWHESIKSQLKQLSEAFRHKSDASTPLSSNSSVKSEVIFCPSRSRTQYVANIEEIQRLIRAGETYEVCLTNHLRAEYALRDPLAFYSDGWMESKPIKGTRPRGRDSKEDAAIAEELANCEKDRAENMMIADLVRNDFGIVARVGSVHVPRLMGVETYTTVHQLVTTVRAQRREDADVVDVLRATFPGGSMTGAPKKRTMHIIRELERGPPIVTPNSVTLGAGGAIVALSDSDDEYDEMLLKARALVATIGAYATGNDSGAGARVIVD